MILIYHTIIKMNRKYQVFVSSTHDDLKEERKLVSQALLESNCIPAGMELFPASNKTSWEIIKKVINDSDYYLLIIAGRYGSLGTDDNGKKLGYTEMEYNYAQSINIPIILFINDHIDNMVAKNVESTKIGKTRSTKFKHKILESHKQVSFWKNPGELVSQIKTSIQSLIQDVPSAGWIKGTDLSIFNTNNEKEIIQIYNYWKLEKIFKTRAEKNLESDPKLETHNLKNIDGIAFGLSSFRSTRENDVLSCIQNGTNIRFLVMNPNSEFAKQRAIEENAHPNSIAASISKLVEWVNKLNEKSTNGKIEIKYYNAMTLDFYWRMDDELYIGPYMYNVVSQQTITYKFLKGGRGFDIYTNYFESLWNDASLCEYPSEYIKKA